MKIFNNPYSAALLTVLTSALLAISAQSQEIPIRGPMAFVTFDINSNGLVSEEEFNQMRAERMSARAAEGRQMRGAATAPAFSEFDTNADGQLTPNEFYLGQQAQMEKRAGMGMGKGRGMGQGMGMGYNMPTFSEYDLNGDGIVVESEFDKARSNRIGEMEKMGYQMRNLANAPSFADIDVNGDGEISSEEFTEHQLLRRQQRAQ